MQLELTMEQAQQLKTLLEQSLPELSHEIAATDNTLYRAELHAYPRSPRGGHRGTQPAAGSRPGCPARVQRARARARPSRGLGPRARRSITELVTVGSGHGASSSESMLPLDGSAASARCGNP